MHQRRCRRRGIPQAINSPGGAKSTLRTGHLRGRPRPASPL